jgi:hypothetical protein
MQQAETAPLVSCNWQSEAPLVTMGCQSMVYGD